MRAQGSALEMPMPLERAAAAGPAAFVRVAVYDHAEQAVLEAWAMLEAVAPCSIYQTRAWTLPWLATLGRNAGITPAFVVALGGDGQPVALLCLGLRRRGPVRVATFLGGKDSNFNMALFRPGLTWTPQELRRLLARAAQALGDAAPDAFVLTNQPEDWNDAKNPFAVLPRQPSPSASFGTRLVGSAEDMFVGKLSKESRKKLRKKEAKLAELGPLTHEIVTSRDGRTALLDSFFAQKLERFRAQNIVSEFDDPAMRRFIETASAAGSYGVGIELHALRAGKRIVAVYGGAPHGGQWSGMFNSFDGDAEIAKCSPGDLLLMAVIRAQCAAGLKRFDLGIGEARYKATFCDETIPLFDTFVPVTLKGRVFLAAKALTLRAKRAVKQNPKLLAYVKRLRALGAWRAAATSERAGS